MTSPASASTGSSNFRESRLSPSTPPRIFCTSGATDLHEIPDNGQPACPRDRGRHLGRHQMRAPTPALRALKIAVRRGRGALTRSQLIAVHRKTHRTACQTPLETVVLEDVGQTLFL